MLKPRVLLVADVQGWAFDINERDMAAQLDGFEFDHMYVMDKHLPDRWGYDCVFLPMHWWIGQWPYSRIAGALRSQWFNSGNRVPPGDAEVALVNRCAAFQVCTKKNYDELKDRCPNVVYLTNPVDHTRFEQTPLREDVVACWNGNAGHQSGGTDTDVKGFYSIVIPACTRARIRLAAAEYTTNRVPHEEMPGFYHEGNVALCATLYEGASNSVMEAMASGLAIIATDVGNHREMADSQKEHFGATGIILVDRHPDAFAEQLAKLTPKRAREMGELNRKEIKLRWSWDAWRDRYHNFFVRAVGDDIVPAVKDSPVVFDRPEPIKAGTSVIKQLIVDHDPAWGVWPDTDRSHLSADVVKQTEFFGDLIVESSYYPAYKALDLAGNRKLPIAYPWIDNTKPPCNEVIQAMVRDLEELAKTHQVILWNHCKNCWPEVAKHLPRLFRLAIVPFADDCPGSTEIKTLLNAKYFDVLYHQMYIWDFDTGEKVPDVYRAAAPDIQCYHRGQTESSGLLDWINDTGFDARNKAAQIRAGEWPPVILSFVGYRGGNWRQELLVGLSAMDWDGQETRFHGVGQRDGALEGREQSLPMGGTVPVYSTTCGAPVAELYAGTAFSVNPQVSSLFNGRLMDLWRCGVVQLIHDPWHELEDHDWVPWREYVPFDGTAGDARYQIDALMKEPGKAADIIEAAFAAVEKYPSVSETWGRIYKDNMHRIVAASNQEVAA